MTKNPGHIGRKISKIRELRGMKQDALAYALGISQQTVSNIENSEKVEEALLEKVAAALEVSVEGIKNFSEENVLNFISNKFDNGAIGYQRNENCIFNPIDKIVQLYDEKIALYERMLSEKNEMMKTLESLVRK